MSQLLCPSLTTVYGGAVFFCVLAVWMRFSSKSSNDLSPAVEGGVSLSHFTLCPLCLHRYISHSPSRHLASPAATQWQPGVWHPESGKLRQHGDQRLHRQLCLYPRKVRGWLCFHGNTQVCPVSQEKGHCCFVPVTTCFLTRLLTCLLGTLTVAIPASSSFQLFCEVYWC